MKISLIDNGLDSLRKGYVHLGRYEKLLAEEAGDSERFSALKDSVLSIQHGVEILFKYSLKEKNEILLFTDISKLKEAYKSRREGTIKELYEFEGIHTVTFKESIERLKDICGIHMDEKFIRNLKKVEAWRNSITHSAVLLREIEVSRILIKFLTELDVFFGPLIGEPYLKGQGRTELDRAYRLTKAVYGELDNKIKSLTVERLIDVLQSNNLKNVTAPSTFLIKDPKRAYAILEQMQGSEIRYGCDFVNMHNSGHAQIVSLANDDIVTIHAVDIRTKYQFCLDALVVHIPEINNDRSPLIFMFAKRLPAQGENPYVREDVGCTLQHGVNINADDSYHWEKEMREQSMEDYDSDTPQLPPHKEAIRFLSGGPVCFMNIQQLEYGSAHRLLDNRAFQNPEALHAAFQDLELDE